MDRSNIDGYINECMISFPELARELAFYRNLFTDHMQVVMFCMEKTVALSPERKYREQCRKTELATEGRQDGT